MGGGIIKSKRNAFTLIELLAIIVILAIIAVITVPIILGIIDDASKNAAKDSAYGYKDSVNKTYITELLKPNQEGLKLNGTYEVQDDGTLEPADGYSFGVTNYNTLPVSVSGDKPSSGALTYENNVLKSGYLVIGDYRVEFKSDGTVTTMKNTGSSIVVDDNNDVDITSCPGCKFIFTTGNYAIEGSTAAVGPDNSVSINGLLDDYSSIQQEVEIWIAADGTEYNDDIECSEANDGNECDAEEVSIQRPYFLGIIEDSGKIQKAFACVIKEDSNNNNVPFCLEGGFGESSSVYTSYVEEINTKCKWYASIPYGTVCSFTSGSLTVENNGDIYSYDDNNTGICNVYANGYVHCEEY